MLEVPGWEPGSRPTRSINTPIVLCHHTKMTRELKLSCCQRLPLRLSFNGPFRRIVGVAYSAGDNVLVIGGDTQSFRYLSIMSLSTRPAMSSSKCCVNMECSSPSE